MPTVLGFDHALCHTGYAVWKDKELIDYGNFISELSSKDNSYFRLKEVYTFFEETIIKYSPTHIVLEQMWAGYNIESFKSLVMLNAFLLQLAWKYNIEVKEINIRKYRNFFGIKNKEDVKRYVEKSFPGIIIDKNMDISDAILLSKYIVENNYNLEKC